MNKALLLSAGGNFILKFNHIFYSAILQFGDPANLLEETRVFSDNPLTPNPNWSEEETKKSTGLF